MRAISTGFLVTFSLIAQTPSGDYSITGTVINNQTGEPVRNALVSLTTMPNVREIQQIQGNSQPFVPSRKAVLAGAGGEFEFTGLAEGEYNLAANKPGFTPYFATSDQPRSSVKLSASMSGVELKMSALGVIEGKVVDQFGEPVAHVVVNAYMVNVNDGFRSTLRMRNVDTDDKGQYRMWNLEPGKYYLKAMGRNGGTFTYIGDSGPRYETRESFAAAYPGGAQELDSATPVVIGTSTHGQADFNLTMEPAFKIRGALQNFVQHDPVIFQLRRGSEPAANNSATVNGTTGMFEIRDVVDGSCVLRATQGQATRGEVPVTIRGAHVSDVSVTL